MKIRSFNYHIKEGSQSVFKNGLMSVASIASVSACSFMLIISLLVAINLDSALENLEENIGISLYLGETVTDEEAILIFEELKNISHISTVDYMTKQDALDWAVSEWGDDSGILDGLSKDNPFPRSFEISIDNAQNQTMVLNSISKLQADFEKKIVNTREESQQQMDDVIQNPLTEETPLDTIIGSENTENLESSNLEGSNNGDELPETTTQTFNNTAIIGDENYKYLGIENIRHSQKEAELLIAINSTIRLTTIVLLVVFAFISVGIIINTIKLTVYIRKTEINIMKYLGATDWFIRWPFVVEGIIIGLTGSFISTIICAIGYSQSTIFLYERIPTIINYVEFKNTLEVFLVIGPFATLLGALLGVVGSVSSIKKYLDV